MNKKIFNNAIDEGTGIVNKIVKAVFADDIEDLGTYIKEDVIKPQFKRFAYKTFDDATKSIDNAVSDSVGFLRKKMLGAASMRIFGEEKAPIDIRSDNPSYRQDTNYRQYSQKSSSSRSSSTTVTTKKNTGTPLLDSSAPVTSASPKVRYFDTRAEAERVLECMRSLLEEYQQVRVADYYEFVEMDSQGYTDNSYGWRNLDMADVRRSMNMMYYIDLPRPIDLIHR